MESVANYQFYFSNLAYSEQQNRFLEWMKYAALSPNVQGTRKKYLIPFSPGNETTNLELDQLFNNNLVCISALLIIFGKKYKFYYRVGQHFNNKTLPISQQKNNANASKKIIARGEVDALDHYLRQVETLAEPSATRLVREATGNLTIRDNNDDTKYLPSNMSKRGCYRQYCEQRGKKVVTSHDGSCQLYPIDDAENVHNCISWYYFHTYWKKFFPQLKVSKSSEDICKECYVFFNRNKYKSSALDNEEDDTEDGNTTSSNNSRSKDEMSSGSKKTEESDDEGEKLIMATGDIRGLQNEAEILKASKHVHNAKSMREYLNKKIKEARFDVSSNIPWQERRNCLIGDYAQYMHLPFFGKKQPGDTYYFVPMNVNNFEMVNVAAFNFLFG